MGSQRATPVAEPPRPFLRRAWVAWAVAGLVAVAGAIGSGWMLRERSAADDELARVRADLASTSARADRLAEEVMARSDRNRERRAELKLCLDRLAERVDAYNELNDEYGAQTFYPDSERASEFLEAFTKLRDRARTDASRCKTASVPDTGEA